MPMPNVRWAAPAIMLAAVVATTAALPAAPSSTGDGTFVLDVADRSDATPSIAASGAFVAVAWGATAAGKADVFVSVSRDGGASFGAPVQVNRIAGEGRLGGEMAPRVALVANARQPVPDVVVLWTARGATTEIKTARSTNGGRTFDVPVSLQSPNVAGDRGWPALAVDRDGGAHALWLDHRGMAASRAAEGHEGHAGHQAAAATHDGVAMAQRSGLYYATTAGEREIVKGVCYCCKTALAVTASGKIYGAWRHVYPGNLRDIAFTMSNDAGRTFSSPVRVSEDGWSINGCPDDGPAMAVDQGGVVHLVWPTVIPGDNPEGAIFYASTRDGRTFTARTRVPTLGSPKPSHPQIVADPKGGLVVAWDEVLNGQRVAAARRILLRTDGTVSFGNDVKLAQNAASTYPAMASTSSGLVAVWATGGTSSRVHVRKLRLP